MPPRLLLALVLATTGCMPSVSVEVLEPAAVDVPPHIRTLAVVDRSRPASLGQDVLGTLEGAITGEGILQDREGARQAVAGLADALGASPRFEAVVPPLDRKAAESNLWDRELGWEAARRIARENGAQGIVALEAFDSDSLLEVVTRVEEREEEGRKVRQTVYVGSRETRVIASFRLYDVEEERVIDDFRDLPHAHTWSEEASTHDKAVAALPAALDTVTRVGWDAGAQYGRRIAPSYVWVRRSFYGGGPLKEGRDAARAGDWEGAVAAWEPLVATGETERIRGRAAYDVAVAHEVRGDLEGALEWATTAARLHPKGRTRAYASALRARIADQQRVEEQMAPPEPLPDQPLAIPGDSMQRPR